MEKDRVEGEEEEEARLDLISNLPCDIIRRINSFLPLKQAVRTCALSTVWRRLWAPAEINPIPNFAEAKKFILGTFLRSFDFSGAWKLRLAHPEELIILAMKGVVEKELHLEFLETQKVMTGSFHLRLERSCPEETANFSALRTLHLRSITIYTKDLAADLFSSFRFLRGLKLDRCSGLQSLDIKVDDCLESLSISNCPDVYCIVLSAPGLKSFRYEGILPQILMNDTSNLVDVMLNLRDGISYMEFDCEEFVLLLASFKKVEVLTISGWLLEWLCSGGVLFSQLGFKFDKLKELHWIDCIVDKPKKDSLACFLDATPFLEELHINIDRTRTPVDTPLFFQYWHAHHIWMDCATVKSRASQLDHLKTVRLMGFSDEKNQLLLMDLLLEKAAILESITVVPLEDDHRLDSSISRSQMRQILRNNHHIFPEEISTTGYVPKMAGFCQSYLLKLFNVLIEELSVVAM